MSVTPTTNTSFITALEEAAPVTAEILKKKEAFDILGVENFIPPSNIVNSLVSQPAAMDDALEPMECNGDNPQGETNALLRTQNAPSQIVVPTKDSSSLPTSTTTSSKVTDIDMCEADILDKSPSSKEDVAGTSDANTDGVAECEMQVDSSSDSLTTDSSEDREKKLITREKITEEDINLMCELFYLPYEHGPRATEKLEEIHWLRSNAYVVCTVKSPGKASEKVTI